MAGGCTALKKTSAIRSLSNPNGLSVHPAKADPELPREAWQDPLSSVLLRLTPATRHRVAARYLSLDEPTNHLDLTAIEWLTSFLKQYKGTAVIVSHDRYFLDEAVTSILEIDQGELHFSKGSYTHYADEREERLMREFSFSRLIVSFIFLIFFC